MDINGAWKSTCKVLLGDEVGELADFQEYLRRNIEPINSKKSLLSGENVTISDESFCPSARFISNDEAEQFEKLTSNVKLDLNQIKDIDSIAAALSEKFIYAGKVVLGECSNIKNSHRCTSSHFVADSHEIIRCKYIAHSSLLRDCEYSFGCTYTGEGKFAISSTQFFHSSRCFETVFTRLSSDCYYTANMEGCKNCMFSFNLKSRFNCIGNLELPKNNYNKIKDALVEQIRGELKAKKRVMGLPELLAWGKGPSKSRSMSFTPAKLPQKEVEKAFSDTTQLLFGKRLLNISTYQDWLFRHVRKPLSHFSAKSGKPIYISPLKAYGAWSSAALSGIEAWGLGKNSIKEAQAEQVSLSSAKEILKEITYSTSDISWGTNLSVEECISYMDSSDCFGGTGFYADKKCAYSFYTRECENAFGCELLYFSKFCLKCNHSASLTRCFEVLDSKSSSDCYFCHNVENVRDSMFCFNTKNKNYAIGNVEVGREKYVKIKKLVLDEIAKKLEKDKNLDLDIYNVGCSSKK